MTDLEAKRQALKGIVRPCDKSSKTATVQLSTSWQKIDSGRASNCKFRIMKRTFLAIHIKYFAMVGKKS